MAFVCLFLLFISFALCGTPKEVTPNIHWDFSKGRYVVDIKSKFVPAAECGTCHKQIYKDWLTTRHRKAWSNVLFQDGFKVETSRLCTNCHSPLTNQLTELKSLGYFKQIKSIDPADKIHIRNQTTDNYPVADLAPKAAPLVLPKPPWDTAEKVSALDEGITCVVCHLRGETILTSKKNHANTSSKASGSAQAHPRIRYAPELGSSQFCANCHEFNTAIITGFSFGATNNAMQTTYSEWLDYQKKGGKKSCQGCHMPEGRHIFQGSHTKTVLAGALKVEVKKTSSGSVLRLESKGVGHNFPTGDVFRSLVVEIRKSDNAGWSEVVRLSRTFKNVYNKKKNGYEKVIAGDTSLKYGQAKTIQLPPDSIEYRVLFRYGSEFFEKKSKDKTAYTRQITNGTI